MQNPTINNNIDDEIAPSVAVKNEKIFSPHKKEIIKIKELSKKNL